MGKRDRKRRGGAGRRVLSAVTAGLLGSALGTAGAGAEVGESARVGDSDDPTQASVLLSQASFEDDSAGFAVIGRNDVFADNLGGAGLAGGDGPLLLVPPPPSGAPATVLDEIDRVLDPRDGACNDDGTDTDVYILGGDVAVSEETAGDIAARGYCVTRLFGDSRVETSVAVAFEILLRKGLSAEQPQRGQVLLARTDNPADSASAGAYAAAFDVPIVVTPTNELHPAVRDLLTPGDGSFDNVTLLGGTAALSEAVADEVREVVNSGGFDVPVVRLAGAARDETALLVADRLWGNAASNAAIVNGFDDDFWIHALPGGAISSRDLAPLLYVFESEIPPTTDSYLRQNPVGYLLTVGPETRISETVRMAAEESLGSGA